MPEQIIITLLTTAYSISQQRKMKRRMEAEAEKRKGFKFSVSGQIKHVPVVYGKQAIGGIQTLHKVFDSYQVDNPILFSSFFKIFGSAFSTFDHFNTLNWDQDRSGSKKEFLLVQSALCQEGIEGCKYVKVDDKPWNYIEKPEDESDKEDELARFDNTIRIYRNGGTADSLATINGVNPNNVFTGVSYASMIYKLNRDNPQYQSGVPDNTFFLKGRKVRTVDSEGNLSSTYTYSNNPAWCLLDYLLGDFGRNLEAYEVDLLSFYRAATICDQIVTTNRFIGGRVNGVRPIKELSTFSVFPSEGDTDFIYKAEDTETFYLWNEDTESYDTTTVPTRDIPLYECNITLDTEATVRDNIERLLATMGMAELTWTSEGKYKLILDYPADQAALEALVDSSHVFTEDDIIRETVTISYPSAADRYNRVTVRFDNEHEDFKEDSVSWPELNSTVHQQYLTEDNQQPMTSDLFLEGITDPYHALAKAEEMVRNSRTTYTVKLKVGKKGLSLEPGDFIKIQLPQSDLDDIYRVESIKIFADLTAELSCYYLDPDSLAWNVQDDIPYNSPPIYGFVIPQVQNVVITPGVYTSYDGSIFNSLDVSWDAVDDVAVNSYEVQWKKQSDTVYQSATTKTTNYTIQNVEANTVYDVRVRVITSLGSTGRFSDSSAINTGKATPPNEPVWVSANGVYKAIELKWTNPADVDLAHVEIWENTSNTTAGATKIAQITGNTYTRPNLGVNETYYYFLKAVNTSGVASAFTTSANATTDFLGDDFENGVVNLFLDQGVGAINYGATFPVSPSNGDLFFLTTDGQLYEYNLTATRWELKAETGSIVASDKIVANTITGGLLNTSGIITSAAQIDDAVIENAAIKNGAITTAKIDDLAVNTLKIAGNSVTVPYSFSANSEGINHTFNVPDNNTNVFISVVVANMPVQMTSSTAVPTLQILVDGVSFGYAYTGVTGQYLIGTFTVNGNKVLNSGNHTITAAWTNQSTRFGSFFIYGTATTTVLVTRR